MEKYVKDFEGWNKIKNDTQSRNAGSIVIHEGAVWLMRVGVNVGFEIDGKGEEFVRPVIIVRKINESMFLGIPVSSKEPEDFYRLGFYLFGEKRVAKISQIRSFDKKRCIRFLAMLSKEDFNMINTRIMNLFMKNETPQPLKADEENLGCPAGDNGISIQK